MPRQIVLNWSPPVKKIREMKLKLVNTTGHLIYMSKKNKIIFSLSYAKKSTRSKALLRDQDK